MLLGLECARSEIQRDFMPRYSTGFRDVGKKERENVGILKKQGRGGLPKSHFFYNLTKCIFACQIHSEVLKHVVQ